MTTLSPYRQIKDRLHRTPELFYGPEADQPSEIRGTAAPRDLAKAVAEQFDRVLGYKQLPVRYRVGDSLINPVDLFCSLRRALAEGIAADEPMELSAGEGRLVPMRHINTSYDWAKDWIIFPDGLDASEVVRHALLQTWTLKPAIF